MRRLRRSLLMTPGHRFERLAKAAGLPIDAVIFDLEDGVPGARKAEARATVARALTALPFGRRERIVRINAAATPECEADLAALPLDRLDTLMLPKVERPAELLWLDERLKGTAVTVIATIETPRGLLGGLPIVDATPRLSGVFFGPGDYTMQTGGAMTAAGLRFPRAVIAALAGAAGCDAIDAPYLLDITDAEATRLDADEARSLGFVGKVVFHPAQIAAANAAFSPTPAELHRARRIVDGYARSMQAGEAVALIDGEFIAMDLAPRMQRLLDIANEIGSVPL